MKTVYYVFKRVLVALILWSIFALARSVSAQDAPPVVSELIVTRYDNTCNYVSAGPDKFIPAPGASGFGDLILTHYSDGRNVWKFGTYVIIGEYYSDPYAWCYHLSEDGPVGTYVNSDWFSGGAYYPHGSLNDAIIVSINTDPIEDFSQPDLDESWVWYKDAWKYWSKDADWPEGTYYWHDYPDPSSPYYPGYYEFVPSLDPNSDYVPEPEPWDWSTNVVGDTAPTPAPVAPDPFVDPADPADPLDLTAVELYLQQVRDVIQSSSSDSSRYIVSSVDALRSDANNNSGAVVATLDKLRSELYGVGNAQLLSQNVLVSQNHNDLSSLKSSIDSLDLGSSVVNVAAPIVNVPAPIVNIEGASVGDITVDNTDLITAIDNAGGESTMYDGDIIVGDAVLDSQFLTTDSDLESLDSVVDDAFVSFDNVTDNSVNFFDRMFSIDFPVIGYDSVWSIVMPLSVLGYQDIDISFDLSSYPIVSSFRSFELWTLLICSVYVAIKIVRRGIA